MRSDEDADVIVIIIYSKIYGEAPTAIDYSHIEDNSMALQYKVGLLETIRENLVG